MWRGHGVCGRFQSFIVPQGGRAMGGGAGLGGGAMGGGAGLGGVGHVEEARGMLLSYERHYDQSSDT